MLSVCWGTACVPSIILKPLVRYSDKQKRLNSVTCSALCVFQDEATELVVFVLHSLKNRRDSHMMGESCDEEVELDISRVSCWLTESCSLC